MLVLGMTGYIFNITFSKLKPIVTYSQKAVEHPETIYFSFKNFSVAVGMEHPTNYNQYINESIYTVRASMSVLIQNKSKGYSVNLKKCTLQNFPVTTQYQFSKVGIENMYCLPNDTFTISGTWVDPDYSSLRFDFLPCINTTFNNNSCLNQEIINSYLTNAYASVFYVDLSIDPTNNTNPVQYFVGQPFALVSLNSFQQIVTYLKTNTIIIDNGLIFEDTSTSKAISTDYNINYVSISKPTNNIFFRYSIKLSQVQATYLTSFMKIQTALALIGGIFNFFNNFGIILLHFYSELKFHETLLNKLYLFDLFGGQKSDLIKNVIDLKGQIIQIKNERDIKEDHTSQLELNSILTKNISISMINDIEKVEKVIIKLSEIKTIKHKIKLKIVDLIKYPFMNCFRLKNNKLNFFRREIEFMNSKLDIENIIEKLCEIEKMKELLFTQDQMYIFNLIPFKFVKNYNIQEIPQIKCEENHWRKNLPKNFEKLSVIDRNIIRILESLSF